MCRERDDRALGYVLPINHRPSPPNDPRVEIRRREPQCLVDHAIQEPELGQLVQRQRRGGVRERAVELLPQTVVELRRGQEEVRRERDRDRRVVGPLYFTFPVRR